MNGNGLIQVLVTLAAVILAGFAVFKAYRKPKNGSSASDDAQESTPGGDAGAQEIPYGLRHGEAAKDLAGSALGMGGAGTAPVPAPRTRWNREDSIAIRAKAWQLFSAQYGWMLLLVAAVAALGYVQEATLPLLPQLDWLKLLWVYLTALLLAPVTYNGQVYAALHIWRGEKPRLGLLTAFLPPRRYFRALWLIVLQGLMMLLPGSVLFGGVIAAARNVAFDPILGSGGIGPVLLIIAGFVAIFWLGLRISIIPYALARNPETSVYKAFETGFRATGKRIGALLGMNFCTGWPIAVFSGLSALLSRQASGTVASISSWIALAFTVLYSGYVWLSIAGLAEKMLLDDEARFGAAPGAAEGDGESAAEGDGESAAEGETFESTPEGNPSDADKGNREPAPGAPSDEDKKHAPSDDDGNRAP